MHLEIDIEKVRSEFCVDMSLRLDLDSAGLFGPSGAGKTTLLHLLAGLEKPDRGRIALNGRTLCDTSEGLFVPPHKRRIGVVFQDARLFPHLSVLNNLRFAQWLAPKQSRHLPLDTVVDILEIGSLLTRRTTGLSGGERQRVALARTLLSSPQILLLDEPASALDVNREAYLLPFLKRISREIGIPMILVSHRLTQIRYLTDTLLIVDRGKLLANGTFSELVADPHLARLMRNTDLVNMVRLRATEHHADEGLTQFTLYDGPRATPADPCQSSIQGPSTDCAVGSLLVGMVRPEDIIVSLAPVEYISARNQLRGRIVRIIKRQNQTLCCVDVGTELITDITHISSDELELHPGKTVWCLFKTHSMRYLFEETCPGYPLCPGHENGLPPLQARHPASVRV